MGAGHPESPARIQVIEDQLVASGLMSFLDQQEAPAASKEQLQHVHSIDYIETISGPQDKRVTQKKVFQNNIYYLSDFLINLTDSSNYQPACSTI